MDWHLLRHGSRGDEHCDTGASRLDSHRPDSRRGPRRGCVLGAAQADGFAKLSGIDGVGLENAAKSKLVGILAERLRKFDVYVGEVTIAGSVQGMATATPTAIDPPAIAETFCSLMRTRDKTRVRMTEAQLRNARLSDLGGRHLRAASSGSRARLAWGTRHGRSRPPAASAAALAHRQLRRVCRSRSRRQVPALRTR